jgi:hypothetical protein
MNDPTPETLFSPESYGHWRDLWEEMPAYDAADETPFDTIPVHFSNAKDRDRFLELINEKRNAQGSVWFPSIGYLRMITRHPEPGTVVERNRYPVYVISKGRAESQLTARELDKLGMPYKTVIEPQEFDAYARHTDPSKILQLPFSNLGLGSIPARNWCWEHAAKSGARRHWILDDNIRGFYRFNNNKKISVIDENPLKSVEEWVDRYENVPMAGLNYDYLCVANVKWPPIRLNTRVYSCILLDNAFREEFPWRGRYNEDTDLSIRFLKAGYVTALFNHYLAKKVPTGKMKGGNADELYRKDETFDGRKAMAESLVEQHPDVAKVVWKWERWQHSVNYGPFKRNKLIPKGEAVQKTQREREPFRPIETVDVGEQAGLL